MIVLLCGDIKSTLVQVMSWRRTGDKPLPEPKMITYIDAYMRHPDSIYRVTHLCVSKLTIIGSDNGLAPTKRQAII